jgi:hypothetical protein
MFEIIPDWQDIVHYKFICKCSTLNKQWYKEVLTHLQEAFHLNHPNMWAAKHWVLLHDVALAHQSLPGHQQLARHDTVVLPHPPYPPSLELCIE